MPLCRYYANHANELPSPFKALQTGNVWRADRPQRGRYRQFRQCDIDILGEAGSIAEIDEEVAAIEQKRAALQEHRRLQRTLRKK